MTTELSPLAATQLYGLVFEGPFNRKANAEFDPDNGDKPFEATPAAMSEEADAVTRELLKAGFIVVDDNWQIATTEGQIHAVMMGWWESKEQRRRASNERECKEAAALLSAIDQLGPISISNADVEASRNLDRLVVIDAADGGWIVRIEREEEVG